jgi:hypothetical protein
MMTILERKVALLQKEITVADLASRANCSGAMIRAVIKDIEKSRRIRKVIARAIGKPVDHVFDARA